LGAKSKNIFYGKFRSKRTHKINHPIKHEAGRIKNKKRHRSKWGAHGKAWKKNFIFFFIISLACAAFDIKFSSFMVHLLWSLNALMWACFSIQFITFRVINCRVGKFMNKISYKFCVWHQTCKNRQAKRRWMCTYY
jgi:hypothetical protein